MKNGVGREGIGILRLLGVTNSNLRDSFMVIKAFFPLLSLFLKLGHSEFLELCELSFLLQLWVSLFYFIFPSRTREAENRHTVENCQIPANWIVGMGLGIFLLYSNLNETAASS